MHSSKMKRVNKVCPEPTTCYVIPIKNELDPTKSKKMEEDIFLTTKVSQEFRIREEPVQVTWKNGWPQILASILAYTIVVQDGVYMSYSAILLPQLAEENSDIRIDTSQASWIASLVALALPLSSLITGPLVDKFGRRNICILSCIPFLLSYLSFTFATSVFLIFIGRILSGIAGGFSTAAIIYASEASCTELRSALLCMNSVGVALGILITCILSLWFSWRAVAAICGISTIFCMISLFFIPETPHWCKVFKKDTAAVEKSLKWLYRDEALFEREFKSIFNTKNTKLTKEIPPELKTSKKCKNFFETYMDPIVYKPFLLLVISFLLQQLSGCYIMIFYAVDIFTKVGGYLGGNADEYVSLLLLGIIRFVIAVIVAVISRRIGRRTLLIVSSIGMGLSTLFAAIYMKIYNTEASDAQQPFLMICILSYVSFSAIGLLVIPWTLLGELLPVKVRGNLSGVMIAIGYFFMFVTLKLYPSSVDAFGAFGVFIIFTVVCALNALFAGFLLPETLGKSFDQIEKYFK